MSSSERAERVGILSAVLGAALLAPSARAEDIPHNVRSELEVARDLCVKAGGTPGALEGAIVRHDVDGDGVVDWIVDSRRLPCPGRSRVESTMLFVFVRYQDRWLRILLDTVLDWEVGFARGLPSLKLKHPGEECMQPRKGPCWKTFVFDRGVMRHIRTQ